MRGTLLLFCQRFPVTLPTEDATGKVDRKGVDLFTLSCQLLQSTPFSRQLQFISIQEVQSVAFPMLLDPGSLNHLRFTISNQPAATLEQSEY